MYEKIAIIGMSGCFPDADNPNELFYNCLEGINSIKRLSDEEIESLGKMPGENGYVPYHSAVSDIDKFDHKFFNMTPYEAELTDPQQRIFLECSWAAMEDAGYAVEKYKGKVGVFGSCSINSYFLHNVWGNVCDRETFQYPMLIGADKDFLCTRVSYKLGLSGPSMTIQNACSSSLAALHLACQSLRNRESDMALAGGVSISVPGRCGYYYTEGGPQSHDGVCRPFDDNATGMVQGNGCGVVVIKRLEDALKDRDHIYAVINTSAVSNDGMGKIGFTAPSITGQMETIREAFRHTDINPSDVSFIEAHGTGTKLGDPIEVRALAKAYGKKERNSCALGSIKANIGHLDAAAGITGVIKVALSLYNGIITRNINYEVPNRQIDLPNTPFFVNTNNIRFSREEKRYAAVNSLGMGGTNVHCILENYIADSQGTGAEINREFVLPFSAQSEASLQQMRENLELFFLKGQRDCLSLGNIAYTLCFGRNTFKYRDYIVASNLTEGADRITGRERIIKNEVGEAWKNGETVNWNFQFSDLAVNRVSVPTYPFEKIRHWIEPAVSKQEVKLAGKENSEDNPAVLKELIVLWSKHLKLESIEGDSDFFESNGNSLLAIYLIKDINDKYKTSFSFEDLLDYPTPVEMAAQISDRIVNRPENFHLMAKSSSGLNLFLIHPAGGAVFCYKKLAALFEEKYNFYAISYPNELKNQAVLSEIARYYYEQIKNVQKSGSYLIGGYSFGGNVAYEISRIMEKKGDENKLILIDSLVPTAYTISAGIDNYRNCFPMVIDMTFGNTHLTLEEYAERYSGLEISAVTRHMIEEKRIPQMLPIDSVEQFFTTWVSNHEALCTQEKNTQVSSDILLFYCQEGTPEDLLKLINMKKQFYHSWQNFSTGTFKAIEVPGNHFNVLEQNESMENIVRDINLL